MRQDKEEPSRLRELFSLFQGEKLEMIKSMLASFITGIVIFSIGTISWQALRDPYVELPEVGEEIIFYSDHNRNHLSHVMHSALKRAQKSIFIEIFSLTDQKILQLLHEKARSGIKIEILTDRQYLAQTKLKLPSNVRVTAGSNQGLMHRKVVIIDDEWVWAGSANFTWESLSMHHNLLMGVHSPLLASFITDPSAPEEGRVLIAGQNLEIWNLPKAETGPQRIIDEIDHARSEITIAMFTWTRTDIIDALIQAKKRGIKVQIVLDRRASEGGSQKAYELLVREGFDVRLSLGPQLMHHKFMLIDKKRLFFGSVNWTAGGFAHNRDILLYLPLLTEHQEQTMQTLWNNLWMSSN